MPTPRRDPARISSVARLLRPDASRRRLRHRRRDAVLLERLDASQSRSRPGRRALAHAAGAPVVSVRRSVTCRSTRRCRGRRATSRRCGTSTREPVRGRDCSRPWRARSTPARRASSTPPAADPLSRRAAGVETTARGLLGARSRARAMASSFPDQPGPTHRIIAFMKALGATELLEGESGQSYLDVALCAAHGIRVAFHRYAHPVYAQLHAPFVSHLSALDLLLSCGERDARRAARVGAVSGARPPRPAVSVAVPLFNEEATIDAARSTACAATLEEHGTSFEIVLVDDGSTDRTRGPARRGAAAADPRGPRAHAVAELRPGGGALLRHLRVARRRRRDARRRPAEPARGDPAPARARSRPAWTSSRRAGSCATRPPGAGRARASCTGSRGSWSASTSRTSADSSRRTGARSSTRRAPRGRPASRSSRSLPGSAFAWSRSRCATIRAASGRSRYNLAGAGPPQRRSHHELHDRCRSRRSPCSARSAGSLGAPASLWCLAVGATLRLPAALSLLLLGLGGVFFATAALGVYLARVYRTVAGSPTGYVLRHDARRPTRDDRRARVDPYRVAAGSGRAGLDDDAARARRLESWWRALAAGIAALHVRIIATPGPVARRGQQRQRRRADAARARAVVAAPLRLVSARLAAPLHAWIAPALGEATWRSAASVCGRACYARRPVVERPAPGARRPAGALLLFGLSPSEIVYGDSGPRLRARRVAAMVWCTAPPGRSCAADGRRLRLALLAATAMRSRPTSPNAFLVVASARAAPPPPLPRRRRHRSPAWSRRYAARGSVVLLMTCRRSPTRSASPIEQGDWTFAYRSTCSGRRSRPGVDALALLWAIGSSAPSSDRAPRLDAPARPRTRTRSRDLPLHAVTALGVARDLLFYLVVVARCRRSIWYYLPLMAMLALAGDAGTALLARGSAGPRRCAPRRSPPARLRSRRRVGATVRMRMTNLDLSPRPWRTTPRRTISSWSSPGNSGSPSTATTAGRRRGSRLPELDEHRLHIHARIADAMKLGSAGSSRELARVERILRAGGTVWLVGEPSAAAGRDAARACRRRPRAPGCRPPLSTTVGAAARRPAARARRRRLVDRMRCPTSVR